MLLKDRVVSVESLCLEMGKILIVEVRGEICQGAMQVLACWF